MQTGKASSFGSGESQNLVVLDVAFVTSPVYHAIPPWMLAVPEDSYQGLLLRNATFEPGKVRTNLGTGQSPGMYREHTVRPKHIAALTTCSHAW